MSNEKTGGPAFPSPGIGTRDDETKQQRDGMTLWDWYAGQAVGFAIADANLINELLESNMSGPAFTAAIATVCALMADAMISERKKRGIA